MNKLFPLFSHEISYAIGWTIIHSLWQCTFIALLIAISYAFTKKASAATRYWINSLGLLSCFIASCITFYINYYDLANVEIISTEYIANVTPNIQQSHIQTISDLINKYINEIAIVWFIGFALYISKYIAEFFYCHHIKNHNYKKPDEQLQQLFNVLLNNLGVTRNIQLRISEIVDVPCVIGHFKPVILLPISLALGLTIKQIEVILLHELGHVRRNDYLICSLQTLITLFYFFNPFARWISSKIDEERENACDDIAVSVNGDPLFYAQTLKEFAEMNNNYSPAVAMIGRKNLLINRIKRLFIRDTSFSKAYAKAITLMTMCLFMVGYSVSGYSEEKKTPTDTFIIKLENEPISNLLKLVEQYCPNTVGKVKLKHPDQIISGNFPDLECSSVEHMVRGMDNGLDSTLTGVSIDEKNIPLKNLVTKIESYCPDIKGKMVLKNPETIVGFKTENLSCVSVESAIGSMDKNLNGQSTTIGKISKIEYKEPNEYEKAFFKETSFPKEIIEKGYSGDCKVTFTVDTNGAATDIIPSCISPNDEQKQYFEKLVTDITRKTKFPIKMENGKAVSAKGISTKIKWTGANSTEKPISNVTPPKNELTELSTDIKETQVNNNSSNHEENKKSSLGLSINKDINIGDYKEVKFKSLFFGKKLIDTNNSYDYKYTQNEFDSFNKELITLLNKNFFAAIRNNKLDSLENTNGSKKLIGEVYIQKIIPHWEKEISPYSSMAGRIVRTNHFPFRADITLGIILKDAESKEIVAILEDQFLYTESRTGVSYMSEKQKSNFINEKIISNIQKSITKMSSGLVAYNKQKLPSAEATNYGNNLISLNIMY